jgi:hypothetical protein
MKILEMKNLKNKNALILLSMFLMLSMAASTAFSPNALAQVTPAPGTVIPTYAHMNVFPNPVGVGQQITLGIFLATPLETAGNGGEAHNMTVVVIPPSGSNITLGPFTSDTTGGTVAYYTPSQVGSYTFQFYYGGEALGNASLGGYFALINAPSVSLPVTVTVQQNPVSQQINFPYTPLPTQWWQTPVSAENVQNWWSITGPWLGLAATTFASTGAYNGTGLYNPYTEDVATGHVLWTTPWFTGGVAGGIFGGAEDMGHFWSTTQYTPRYAPVIMNGVIYSTWYTFGFSTSAEQGIRALSLYTGQQLWLINTTSVLRCGMEYYQYTVNDYGVRGPWLWTNGALPASETGGNYIAPPGASSPFMNTTGTQWNLYDAQTGKYCMSVVNGSALTLTTDDKGELIGYFLNATAGKQLIYPTSTIPGATGGQATTTAISTTTGPHITAVNMTACAGFVSYISPTNTAVNAVRSMQTGYIWDAQVPTNISGGAINPALGLSAITGNTIVLTAGYVHGAGAGSETAGWLTVATMSATDGKMLTNENITYAGGDNSLLPYTRTTQDYIDGLFINANDINYADTAYSTTTGAKVWSNTFTGLNGAAPDVYDQFSLKNYNANGAVIWIGLGGDIWCQNVTDGSITWYTNTTQLIGQSGLETPYNVWPLWVFSSSCTSNGIAYLTVGHEYDPPLFRGAQIIGVNITNGADVWNELDTSVTSTAIAYGKLVSLNAYDNQLYCFGKGPSDTTVTAPDVGVTTNTPVTLRGTVMDVSTGATQQAVAANFPNGLPCVSDASESNWMEFVYQQQQCPNNITGVPVTISVLDSNHNLRTIGTTTSDGSGLYTLTWTPDIVGNYTVIANFGGSNAYYPSSAETSLYASAPPTTTAPTVTSTSNLATTTDLMTYIVVAIIAIIIAIAIATVLMLRKK